MADQHNFPDIKNVDSNDTAKLIKHFKGLECYSEFNRIGPKGYLFPQHSTGEISAIFNMPITSSDTFVLGFQRSGTTWSTELLWLLLNDLDYTTAASIPLIGRFLTLETSMLSSSKTNLPVENFKDKNLQYVYEKYKQLEMSIANKQLQTIPDRRFLRTHLPLSLLPPDLLDTTKVVYIARDPRDVAVSLYHYSRLMKYLGYDGDFKTFWNLFESDMVIRAPYFEHVKEAWRMRHHPNMLFLFYEELSQDLSVTVRRIANFFNKNYNDEQIASLCQHLSFENFKENKSVEIDFFKEFNMTVPGEEPFVRKGKVGAWQSYFDEDMKVQAEQWIEENLRNTDLSFPLVG